jgi:hypothetical protein
MKLELFQGFWHGRPLPILQWACLSSFVEHGHSFDLYTYEDIEVPSGITLREASKIVPYEDLFIFNNEEYKSKDLGPFSDLFRFKLLREIGGWWVDIDVLCTANNYPKCDYAWAQELPELALGTIGTSQIKLPRGDPLTIQLYDACSLMKNKMTFREEIGPKLLSDILAGKKLPKNHWGTSNSFYPLRWIEAITLWLPQFREVISKKAEEAYFISCWNSMPLYIGLDMEIMPPDGSYLKDAYQRYASEKITRKSYTAEDVRERAFHWFNNANRPWAINELEAVVGQDKMNMLLMNWLFP